MNIFAFYGIVASVSALSLFGAASTGDETLIFLVLLLELFILMSLTILFGKQVIKTLDKKEKKTFKLMSREGRILTFSDNKIHFFCMDRRNELRLVSVNKRDALIIRDPYNYVVERKIFEKRYSEWLFLRSFYYRTVRYEYEIHVSGQDDLMAG